MALLPAGERARVSFDHIGTGDEAYRAKLVRLVAAGGLSAQVVFHGAEPSSERLLGVIDALVVASSNEPFSVAMLEALAAGVPVLAADSGGGADIITDGLNGRRYCTGEAAGLAALLREWLARSPAWPVEQIRATTVGIDRVAGQWAKVYSAL